MRLGFFKQSRSPKRARLPWYVGEVVFVCWDVDTPPPRDVAENGDGENNAEKLEYTRVRNVDAKNIIRNIITIFLSFLPRMSLWESPHLYRTYARLIQRNMFLCVHLFVLLERAVFLVEYKVRPGRREKRYVFRVWLSVSNTFCRCGYLTHKRRLNTVDDIKAFDVRVQLKNTM